MHLVQLLLLLDGAGGRQSLPALRPRLLTLHEYMEGTITCYNFLPRNAFPPIFNILVRT